MSLQDRPYRFSGVRQSSAAGCYGWAFLRPIMVATEEEGRALVAAPMKAGVLEHTLDKARLSPDGSRLLGFDHIVTRKRKKVKK